MDLDQHSSHGVCPDCVSITDNTMHFCGECGAVQPDAGWPSLHDERDPWLGATIEENLVIRQRLGVGGSARVYRLQRKTAPRRLAVKLVDLDSQALGAADVTEERVRREFMMVSGLTNSHIVQIEQFVRPSRRTCGFVMEFAEGITLRAWIDQRGALSVDLALEIARQVAVGLQEAHAAGIVHRDIKPENLMLEELEDGGVHVRIMDFGIAQWGEHGALTQGFIGTPYYASPEQIMGEPTSASSDVYSLGATLYAALTGRPPHTGASAMDIMRAHVLEDTPRLSAATKTLFTPMLEQLVEAMMERSPQRRPQSMEALIERIDVVRRQPGHDEVIASSLSEASELFENSETISGESIAVHKTPHHIVAVSTGRVVELDGDAVVAVVPGTDDCRRVPLLFADIVTAAAASEARFFVGTSDGRVFVEQEGTWFTMLETPDQSPVTALKASNANDIVVGTAAGDVLIKRGRAPWCRLTVGARVRALAVSNNGEAFAVATNDGVHVYQDSDASLWIEHADVTDLCFSEDEYLLALLDEHGGINVRGLHAEVAPVLHSIDRPVDSICALDFSPTRLRGVIHADGAPRFVDI